MVNREAVKAFLNQHYRQFGVREDRPYVDPRTLDPSGIGDRHVVAEGTFHGCPVIPDVLARNATPFENVCSYNLKNQAFAQIDDLFTSVGRHDLSRQWNSGEKRRKTENTHPELRPNMVMPDQINQRQLVPKARIPQMDLSDFFKTLELKGDERLKLSPQDFSDTAVESIDISDFCSNVAAKAAIIFKNRGVDNITIANILAASFAKTGLVREYGQQKPAEKLVDTISSKIIASGKLPGLASEFKKVARPKVRRFYKGSKNPQLS